ncbi:hypothetical protein ACFU96_27400 [Streptomyces sp. NPDC057620]|uniref:hypothetical protein n=1 Tax=Streptomyces sp. NPDC057620 TaxID=3346185 RepID=UPI0036894357
MPPTPSARGPVRSAAAVNEEIRQLVQGAGRRLTDDEKGLLERLYVEWAAAVRAEVTTAA